MKRVAVGTALACWLVAGPLASNAAPQLVVSEQKVPFNSAIYVADSTAPEWVYFSGSFNLVSQLTPQDPVQPADPIFARLITTASDITGVGQTSGLRYSLTGPGFFEGQVFLPADLVVVHGYKMGLPKPVRSGSGIPWLNVPISAIISFSRTGGVANAAAPPSGLIGWWRAEQNAADVLGDNNGTLVSESAPVSFVPGKVGDAFAFAGQGYVQVANPTNLNQPTVTVAAWVNSTGPGPFACILSKGGEGSLGGSFMLSTGAGLFTEGIGGLVFSVFLGSGVGQGDIVFSPDAGPGVWDGNWHLAVGTFDRSTARLYVDGVEVGAGTAIPTNAPTNIAYDLPYSALNIGAYSAGDFQYRFTGDIDEVQLYDRALFPAEILGLFQAVP